MNFGPIGSQFGGGGGDIFSWIIAGTAIWAAVAGYAGFARGAHKLFADVVLDPGRDWKSDARDHLGEVFRSSLALGYALSIGYFAFLSD